MKILLAEDNFIAALEIQDQLEGLGWHVVGPIADAAEALELARGEDLDAALLDIRLRDGLSYEVARALRERGIAFCFSTGYTTISSLPGDLEDIPHLDKPFLRHQLREVLEEMSASGRQQGSLSRSPRDV